MQLLPHTWERLNSIESLEQAIKASETQLVALFKHSSRCGVSFMAEERLAEEWNFDHEVRFFHLDLIAHRAVSNAIAERLGVPHQSPQLLLLKNGKVIKHASHNAIRTALIEEALE